MKELQDHLDAVEGLLDGIGGKSGDAPFWSEIGRHLHAIKGSSPIFGARPISEAARELEDTTKLLAVGTATWSSELAAASRGLLVTMRAQLEQFRTGETITPAKESIQRLRLLLPERSDEERLLRTLEEKAPELMPWFSSGQRARLRECLRNNEHVLLLQASFARGGFNADLRKLREVLEQAGTIVGYAVLPAAASESDQRLVFLFAASTFSADLGKKLAALQMDVEELTAVGKAFMSPERTPPKPPTARDPAGRKKKVLLADDSDATRELYRVILLGAGYQVEVAHDGEEALSSLRHTPFDLVITDDKMPKLTGLELIGILRSDGAMKHIPVIMMSGEAGEDDRDEALKTGADRYFVKGAFEREELMESIRDLLGIGSGR